jgi:hypothetical protein
MTRAPLTEDTFAGSEDRGLVVTDVDGTVRHTDRHAQRLLHMV